MWIRGKRQQAFCELAERNRLRGNEADIHMKAIVCHNYGPPDVLRLEEIEKPTSGDGEVLTKVCAAAVNPVDLLFRGTSYMVRVMTGPRKPKEIRLGHDVAGQVEAVGRNVSQFKPGDAVFGTCKGAFAEYVCASESALVLKPDNVAFEQAASVPIAALTALQGLRLGGMGIDGLGDKGQIQPRPEVLINGASGGVGTFAVQIAKSFGADVAGVCSTRNVEMVRSIGADRVVDYMKHWNEMTKRRKLESGSGDRTILSAIYLKGPSGCFAPSADRDSRPLPLLR